MRTRPDSELGEKMLLRADAAGILCPAGRFVIDPRRRVDRAVVTHAHLDHVRRGCGVYHATRATAELLRARLPRSARIEAHEFAERFVIDGVALSFHPAGHILGSAQVRLERDDLVCVVSGDYKRQSDPSCEPFEPQACDVFVTEATFGDPRFVWEHPDEVVDELATWWDANRAAGSTSVLFAYVLGKSQRVLAELALRSERPIWVHSEIAAFNAIYERFGVRFGTVLTLARRFDAARLTGALVIAPPRCFTPTWLERFGDVETAHVTGWSAAEFGDGKRAPDRCFRLSDHVDWPALLATVSETGARAVRTVHGDADALVTHLRSLGVDAQPLSYGSPTRRREGCGDAP